MTEKEKLTESIKALVEAGNAEVRKAIEHDEKAYRLFSEAVKLTKLRDQ